jgi:nucleotide-binding universal stress UspA family protein
MKKILVPIDNTRISKIGALYAARLASKIKAELILLAVINASSSPRTLKNWKKLEEQMVRKEKEDVKKMIEEIKEEVGKPVRISFKHVLGFPVEEMVNKFVRENKVDLVVMATGGARGLKKVLGATNTASVIDHTTVPVVAVPRDAAMPDIRKIVYATDMVHLDDEIKLVANFAKLFDATIEILYVASKDQSKRDRQNLQSILIRMAKYSKIHFNAIKDADIANGLNAFVSKNKADVLATFTHKLDFFEKLFDKSITRRLAFESKIPLLAFNKSNS